MHQAAMMRRIRSARGFTLVEVMIATVVFAVGIMAVITMEFSAIRAYTAARDQTVATDIGYRTISLMRMDTGRWFEQGELSSVVAGAEDGGGTSIAMNSMYNPGATIDPGGNETIIGAMLASPWTWQPVTTSPVDENFAGRRGARYCVFVRGASSPVTENQGTATLASATQDISSVVRAQIAVVYPGREAGFSTTANSCTNLPGCAQATISMLQPQGIQGTALPPLEVCGWRAVYMGAVMSRSNG